MRLMRNDERGSLPFALLVAIVVSGLVVVLVGYVLQSQRTVRFDRSFTTAIQGADGGVQDAYHRLSNDLIPPLDVGDAAGPFTTEVDDMQAEWTVERLGAREYEIVSTTDVAGVERTAVATIEARSLLFPGAFGDRLVALNGTSTHIDSYESRTADASCSPGANNCWGDDPVHGTGKGALGTNDDFDFDGNTVVKRAFLYDWLDNPPEGATETEWWGDRCSGNPCAEEDVLQTVDDPLEFADDDAMRFITEKFEAGDDGTVPCDDPARQLSSEIYGGSVGNTTYPDQLEVQDDTDTANPEQGPAHENWDNYWCADNLEFVGDTTLIGASVEKPVVIFVKDYVKVSQPQSVINCPECPDNLNDVDDWRSVRPDAGSLQIYVASDSDAGGGDVFVKSGSTFAGVIHAPRARCGAGSSGGGGAGVHIYGSVICRTIDNVGNWKFHWDETLHDLSRGIYDIANWHEGAQS